MFRHPVVKFFDKRVGFCWKAYRNLGTGFTCANLVMDPFIDTPGTTTPLTAFDEKGITYLATTNACLTLLIRVSTLFTILPIKFGDNLGWIRTYLMISLPFKSLLLFSGYFYTPVLLSVGASTSRQSPFWVHKKRAFALLRCMGIGKL